MLWGSRSLGKFIFQQELRWEAVECLLLLRSQAKLETERSPLKSAGMKVAGDLEVKGLSAKVCTEVGNVYYTFWPAGEPRTGQWLVRKEREWN